MRKLICGIILTSVMLCLSACQLNIRPDGITVDNTGESIPAAGGRQDIPLGSEEFEKLQHEVFVANQLDELLKKHSSVIFDLTDAPENDYDWRDYFYITGDVYYYECEDYAEYDFGRYFYSMENIDREGGSAMYYGINLKSDPDIKGIAGYQFPPEGNEDLWSNNENEEHVACYIENGLLYIKDRQNPEASREWFGKRVPKETYDGQTVYSEVLADAETKEIQEFNNYLEDKDGVITRVINYKAFYDEPEPRRVRNMRAAFERYCENTIDATMVVDPGTDREISESMTIPVGSNIKYRSDNPDSTIVFDNAEATELTHWDGMKDKSTYIFTEPTEEQLKRYEELLNKIREEMSGEQ